MNISKVDFSQYIESFEDFPKKGVVFRDFTPLLADPLAFRAAIEGIEQHFSGAEVTKIAAIEAKGFTLGAALAYKMQKPLSLIRKPNLVPGLVDRERFVKEYGTGEYQIKMGQFTNADRVLIVYDIMAGAGATRAAINLIARSGAGVTGCAYVIELGYLGGRAELTDYDLFSLVTIDALV